MDIWKFASNVKSAWRAACIKIIGLPSCSHDWFSFLFPPQPRPACSCDLATPTPVQLLSIATDAVSDTPTQSNFQPHLYVFIAPCFNPLRTWGGVKSRSSFQGNTSAFFGNNDFGLLMEGHDLTGTSCSGGLQGRW